MRVEHYSALPSIHSPSQVPHRFVDSGLPNRQTHQEKAFLPVGEQALINIVEQSNKSLQGVDTYLKVSVHEKTQRIIVKIVNTNTDEVVKEVPSEKMLDLVQKLCEQLGIFIDEKR
ncbi:flagellar protein FlaG [Paenibacillus sp. ACRRX]|uniref:flagellar protein FlaG n=1 Tax=Paenibacillus sp. ACRRX TaxID=2918206 RepID=UPI001EF520F8|nr:flagellar protein FlaG [Paenibacillus sp. ACRRX]MCG7407984.1 flagellar protein FlaG [Paenibacillus sp. ACRRX]